MVACCNPNDSDPLCIASSSNICSKTAIVLGYQFYAYCPQINAQTCGISLSSTASLTLKPTHLYKKSVTYLSLLNIP